MSHIRLSPTLAEFQVIDDSEDQCGFERQNRKLLHHQSFHQRAYRKQRWPPLSKQAEKASRGRALTTPFLPQPLLISSFLTHSTHTFKLYLLLPQRPFRQSAPSTGQWPDMRVAATRNESLEFLTPKREVQLE